MLWDLVGSVLASFGGAAIIVGAFAHFLGKVWAERIATQTLKKYEQEFELSKQRSAMALEEFKTRAEAEIKDREQFGGISKDVYQDFFKNRVETYVKLMQLKNRYISEMDEDAAVDETERWGDIYYRNYIELRKVLVGSQLFISNDLEKKFYALRMEAAKYTKEADLAEAYALGEGAEPYEADEERIPIHNKFHTETHNLMEEVFSQIDIDVGKLRSRIDLDRA